MRQKSIILGLVLFLTGAAAFGWVLTEQRKEKRLLQEQQVKLDGQLSRLNEVAGGEIDIKSLAYIVPDDNWQQQLNKHNARKETRELVFNGAILCLSAGGAIFAWWLSLATARLVITRTLPRLAKFSTDFLSRRSKSRAEQPLEEAEESQENVSMVEQQPHSQQSQLQEHSEVLTNSGWQNPEANPASHREQDPSEPAVCQEIEPHLNNPAKNAEKIDVLLCDEKSVETDQSSTAAGEAPQLNAKLFDQLAQDIRDTALSGLRENSSKLENSLKTQTKNLEKQVAEFKQMAQTVQQTAIERSDPVNDSLRELTQQVSAIRQYASCQQDKMEKLQDGYDWNIIRTFCLRVIRCIDNLEDRIRRLSKHDIETTDLEEVRDELLFALESSGVEQFEPEIGNLYRGQEKSAEAVKDKQPCNDPKLKGRIAKVIRLGYRCVISEEDVKIVRAARVKLFG